MHHRLQALPQLSQVFCIDQLGFLIGRRGVGFEPPPVIPYFRACIRGRVTWVVAEMFRYLARCLYQGSSVCFGLVFVKHQPASGHIDKLT